MMKRLLMSGAVLLTLGGWAVGQPSIIVTKGPQIAFDVSKHAPKVISGEMDGSDFVDQGAKLTTHTCKMGLGAAASYSHTRGIRDPLYVPAGDFFCNSPWLIGFTPATDGVGSPVNRTQTIGGKIGTGGGLPYVIDRNSNFSRLANVTRLIWFGSRTGGSERVVQYGGFGWYVGAMELWGNIINTGTGAGTNWANRDTELDKCPIGFAVEELDPQTDSFPEGHLFHEGIALSMFDKGIRIHTTEGTPSVSNLDNLTWGYIHADTCDDVYYCDASQAFTHTIGGGTSGQYCDRIFNFQHGGGLRCNSWTMQSDHQTLLTIGATYHRNYGNFIIRNLNLDATADDLTLIALPASADERSPVHIEIYGQIQDQPIGEDGAFEYDVDDLITGEIKSDDEILIRFTGPPGPVGDFNSQSTITGNVDENGNWEFVD